MHSDGVFVRTVGVFAVSAEHKLQSFCSSHHVITMVFTTVFTIQQG